MLPHSYRMSWSRGVHHQVYTHTRNNHVGRGGSDQRQPKDEQCGGSGEVCVSLVGGGGGMYISSNICNGGKNDKYLLNRDFLCLVSL